MKFTNSMLLRSMTRRVAPHKMRFFAGTLVRITSDLSALLIPLGVSWIVTFAATYTLGSSLDMFWLIVGSLVGVQIFRAASINLSKVLLYTLGENLAIEAQTQGMRHLWKLDLLWHEKENTGNKLKKISRAGAGIDRIFRLYEGILIEGVINVVAISIILFHLRWELAAMIVFFAVTYFLLGRLALKNISARVRRVNTAEEHYEGLKFESLNSIHTVKSLGMYEQLAERLEEKDITLREAIWRRILTVRISWGTLGAYQGVFRTLLLTYTALMVFQGNLEIGIIALVMSYFGLMEEAASEFAELHQELVLAKISIAQLEEILSEKPITEHTGALDFPRDWESFQFTNVSFALGEKQILKNLSFCIKRGEKVGIVGISGAGKSTLMKLMLKLYDGYEGEIAFDDVALRDIRRASYIASVATVPQDTEVFHFSLQENITLATENTDDEEVRVKKAMHIAHVDDFVDRLPEKEHTLIGEKGVKLSGGERQRLGIARAVYREPDILLLDEATSHLDATSEQKIQDALHTFFQGVTAIVIAHRLSTLKEMDRILVIKEGQLAEEGSFEELLAKEGEFWALWQKQAL